MSGVGELASQPVDVDVDDVGSRIESIAPDELEQHAAIQDLAATRAEREQQIELRPSEVETPRAAPGDAPDRVELDAVQLDDLDPLRRPPQQRPQPREQLGKREGLDEVVVRAALEPSTRSATESSAVSIRTGTWRAPARIASSTS